MVEELKKIKAQASIFSSSEGEDIEGEYTDPILSPDLMSSSDYGSKLKTKVRVSHAQETNLPTEIEDPTFGRTISQLVFTPSLAPLRIAPSDHLGSEQNNKKSGDIMPLDLPSPGSPDF